MRVAAKKKAVRRMATVPPRETFLNMFFGRSSVSGSVVAARRTRCSAAYWMLAMSDRWMDCVLVARG